MNLNIFVGRCDPFHLGHKRVLSKMKKNNDDVLVILGSVNAHLTGRDMMFSYRERKEFVKTVFDVDVMPIPDMKQNDLFIGLLNDIIKCYSRNKNYKEIVFFGGCEKDIAFLKESGFKTKIVDRSEFVVTATDVRKALEENDNALVEKLTDKKISAKIIKKYEEKKFMKHDAEKNKTIDFDYVKKIINGKIENLYTLLGFICPKKFEFERLKKVINEKDIYIENNSLTEDQFIEEMIINKRQTGKTTKFCVEFIFEKLKEGKKDILAENIVIFGEEKFIEVRSRLSKMLEMLKLKLT